MLCIPYQQGLELLAQGGSGLIYDIDHTFVLKSPLIYAKPRNLTPQELEDYKYHLVYSHADIERERSLFLKIPQHVNISYPIATHFSEGFYYHKYIPLAQLLQSTRLICFSPLSTRILWYQDILCGLNHLHHLGIAHTDVRLPNLLYNATGHVLLCDFSSGQQIGSWNPVAPVDENGEVDLNGFSRYFTDATDRFATASLIFEFETGKPAKIRSSTEEELRLPDVSTGCSDLDRVVTKAWHGEYNTTMEMLSEVKEIASQLDILDTRKTPTTNTSDLSSKLDQWRRRRLNSHGQVLTNLLQADELEEMQKSIRYRP